MNLDSLYSAHRLRVPIPALLMVAIALGWQFAPPTSHAGPSIGETRAALTLFVDSADPKKRVFRGTIVSSTNPQDPMADFGTLVTGSARDKRSKESIKLRFEIAENAEVGIQLGGRIRVKQGSLPPRLRPIKFFGLGAGSSTANSFATTSGRGKIGKFNAKFSASAISTSPGQLEVKINVQSNRRSPIGRRMTIGLRGTF